MPAVLPHRLLALACGFALTGSLALAFTESTAWAQEHTSASAPDREEQRKALYKEGVALADAGRWEDALLKFAAVVELRSAPAALLALATAQEKTGKLLAATSTYRKAADDARTAGEEELTQQAESSRSALMSRVPRIFIHLPADAANALISIDGNSVTTSEQGTLVDPGAHRVVVQAPGHAVFEQRFDLARFEHRDVMVSFDAPAAKPAAAVPPSPRPAPAPPQQPSRALLGPAVVGGVGLAAGITGIVLRSNARADYDSASDSCVDAMCVNPADVARGNDARQRMLASTVIASVGFAAVAGAAVWWLLPSSAEPAPRGKRSTSLPLVGVGVSPHAVALTARGVFF